MPESEGSTPIGGVQTGDVRKISAICLSRVSKARPSGKVKPRILRSLDERLLKVHGFHLPGSFVRDRAVEFWAAAGSAAVSMSTPTAARNSLCIAMGSSYG